MRGEKFIFTMCTKCTTAALDKVRQPSEDFTDNEWISEIDSMVIRDRYVIRQHTEYTQQ